MGSRHQLFVVARIHGHYRRLAAVHSQYHSGETALRRCLSLLRIFRAAQNRVPIQQELIAAQRRNKHFWTPEKGDKTATSGETLTEQYGNVVAPFPFITTCLVLGASYNATEGYQCRVHSLPFNMQFDRGDNNDGITIIDVTEAQKARYCFVNLEDRPDRGAEDRDEDWSADDARTVKAKTPLSASSYLWGYYDKTDQSIQESFGELIRDVEMFPLLDTASLDDAWHGKDERKDHGTATTEEELFESTQSSSGTKEMPSLKESATDKFFEAALGGSDVSQAWLSEILQIPGLHTQLKDRLYQSALHLAPSNAILDIICASLANETLVDLGCFRKFSSTDLCAIIETLKESDKMTHLNLSNHPNIAGADLCQVLSTPSALQTIYLLETPQIPTESIPNLINSSGSMNVYHTELLRAAFQREPAINKPELIKYIETISSLPGFSTTNLVTGMVWISASARGVARKQSDLTEERPVDWAKTMESAKDVSPLDMGRVEYGCFPLRDVPLSPRKLVSGLTNFVKCFTNSPNYPRPQYASDVGLTAAKAFAMSSSTTPAAEHEVGPFPEALFTAASTAAGVVFCPWPMGMLELRPGQWTVVMINEDYFDYDSSDCNPNDGTARTRYALVSPMEHDRKSSQPTPEYRVLDMESFLRESLANSTNAKPDLEELIESWNLHSKDRLAVSEASEINDILAVLPEHISRKRESKGFEMAHLFPKRRH